MSNKIVLSSDKIKREKKVIRRIKIALLIFILLFLILYLAMGIIYNSGNFSITLDKNLYFERGLIIYDDPNYKVYRTELFAKAPDSFDNISYKWIANDVNEHDGSHNGDNYVAYTFYIENTGDKPADYWSEIIIDDVIKGVDEAVRIRVYKDDEYITYAKRASNGEAEEGTTPFESERLVRSEHVEKIMPGEKTKYTIVLWLEGSDPECTDNILGGEFKAYMAFNSEFVEENS